VAYAGDGSQPPRAGAGDEDLKQAEAMVRKATTRPLLTVRTPHYQAIGDASELFIKLTLSDCEQITAEFLKHFQSRGFDVKLPDHRLTVIVFIDERPFERLTDHLPPGTMGFYSKQTNWLALFDFRNVPMKTKAAGQTNMETVTHEATHQLTFNTGLLDRQVDVPLCIVEGLAMYGERRRLTGTSEPGQVNARRLDELARVQRRLKWIRLVDLLEDDRGWFGGDEDRRMLGYAESWLMVYHLMTDRARLPQFRDYLKSLRARKHKTDRLSEASSHFGDLGTLDQELRLAAVRLQRSR
jgi:hypothetical protein